MKRRGVLHRGLWGALLLWALPVSAQYFDNGRSPASIRWLQRDVAVGRMVYPDYFGRSAGRVAALFDTVAPNIAYGFDHAPLRLPVALFTQNMQANGLVIWAPKRMELRMIPDQQLYAMPWHKQLVVHEYRHAVQYGNLYRNFMKPLGWFIGQHSGLISIALAPVWLLEGDAVQAETQFSEFGRALQPSFTIEYRALLAEETRDFHIDKWFCRSYKDYIPNHYQLGYQITAFSREKYGDDIWARVMDYASRRPYTVLTTYWALRKYYGSSVGTLFRETFDDLRAYWASLPQTGNSSEMIPSPVTSYTTYDSPMPLGDKLLAFKSDLDRPNRLVEVDPDTGRERRVAWTGLVSTPPALRDSVVWWTEFRGSLFWDHRVFSRAVSYDLRDGRRRVVRDRGNALYATPLPGGGLATVGYDYRGTYHLQLPGRELLPVPDTLSIHGMAYDDRTGTLAVIGLSDAGMAFYRVEAASGALRPITRPNLSTVYNLRAGDGKLSYNSIQSGKDEVHLYDLIENREYRLTESRYGSFSPSPPDAGGVMYMTTYSLDGYRLARQAAEPDSLPPVVWARLPHDAVNPPRRRWDSPRVNSVDLPAEPDTVRGVRRYRKGLHLFNFHSWLPAYLDPFAVVNESRFDIHFGATAMSQDLLASTTASFAYGYSGQAGNMFSGRVNYGGLAPKFELNVAWQQRGGIVYGATEEMALPDPGSHFQIGGKAYLPFYLSSGHVLRTLTPNLELIFQNSRIYNPVSERFDRGLGRMLWSLSYVEQVRRAPRDFIPRWGYALQVTGLSSPFRNDFGQLYSFFGRVFLPGVAAHHSLSLRGNYQYQTQESYHFYYKDLFPRGALYNRVAARYGAFSADYQLPLCYPDWGIPSLLFFNRIRLRGYFDYARFRGMSPAIGALGRLYTVTSYGGEITFDMRAVRMPVNDTSLGIHLYKPSDRRGVVVGASLSFPL